MIRVATVDDHPMFLDGLRRVLKRMKNVDLVAQGTSADDAVQIAKDVKPDLMLIDITMPGGGLEAASSILERDDRAKIILLTASDDEDRLSEALAMGVRGYVLKAGAVNELHSAISSVRGGGTYVSAEFAMRVVVAKSRRPQRHQSNVADFTLSERRILDLLVHGYTNKQIAEKLDLAVPTVKNALSVAFYKLKVRTRLQALLAWREAQRR